MPSTGYVAVLSWASESEGAFSLRLQQKIELGEPSRPQALKRYNCVSNRVFFARLVDCGNTLSTICNDETLTWWWESFPRAVAKMK